jgi:hypothetical protein
LEDKNFIKYAINTDIVNIVETLGKLKKDLNRCLNDIRGINRSEICITVSFKTNIYSLPILC